MYLCYIDESGTSQVPGNTSHFILAGLSIPVKCWKYCENEIDSIKRKFDLLSVEIHTGWLLRKYQEQRKVPDFEKLDFKQRRSEINKYRITKLLQLQKASRGQYKATKKYYEHTKYYVHLTFNQRVEFVTEIAKTVGAWSFARLFAECIDKTHFDQARTTQSIDEQALEQIVSRFERCLNQFSKKDINYGLLIHDNNQTIAKKHTELMRAFHKRGTLWTNIDNIIETPLFVDSNLTSMIQIADLCAYSLRRYLENSEEYLFGHIFKIADRKGGTVVGVRHFTNLACACKICAAHRINAAQSAS